MVQRCSSKGSWRTSCCRREQLLPVQLHMLAG